MVGGTNMKDERDSLGRYTTKSKPRLGVIVSKDTRIKMSLAKIGKKPSNFKDSGYSYASIHDWVYRHKGKPLNCSKCGLDKIPKNKKRYFEWANVSGQYKRDLDDFIALCVPCHRKQDDVVKKMWITRRANNAN